MHTKKVKFNIMRYLFKLKKGADKALLYLILIMLIVIFCFPVYWMLLISITPGRELYKLPPDLIPAKIDFSGFVSIFSRSKVLSWLMSSIKIVFFTTLFTLFVGIPAGYSLSRMPSKKGEAGAFMILIMRTMPATLLVIPLHIVFGKIGLLDTHLCLIIAYATFAIPFAVWMLKGYFDTIPRELEEAAIIDGCSEIGALIRIIIPIAGPGIVVSAIYCIVIAWSEFLFANTFINSTHLRTISVGITTFIGEFGTDWNEIFATAVVSTIPVIFCFLFTQQQMIQGLTAGSVKG